MTIAAAGLIAASPGPAMHMALLGIVVVAALIVYAIVRARRKREAEEVETLDHTRHAGEHDHSGHRH